MREVLGTILTRGNVFIHYFLTYPRPKKIPVYPLTRPTTAVKHILIQPPTEDTAYKGGLKNYFNWKKGFIDVSFTGIWRLLMPVFFENLVGD